MSFNFTQPMSGSSAAAATNVSVTNFPLTQVVTGSVTLVGTPQITGSVGLTNVLLGAGLNPASASAVTQAVNTLPLAQYRALPLTGSDLMLLTLQSDISGTLKVREQFAPAAEDNINGVIGTQNVPLAISSYTWSTSFTSAITSSLLIKAAPGVLRSLSARIDQTAETRNYYLQLFDAASMPAEGTTTTSMLVAPYKVQHVTGSDAFVTADFTQNGIYASVGIMAILSSTEFTKTITGSFMTLTALYK
jgi:hypothetical protein